MKIRLFTLLLCFVPYISNGSAEHGFYRDEELFQESLVYLGLSLDGLSTLARNEYVPALQLLGFLSHDLEKAENFVKEYNARNIRPKWPLQGPSPGFLIELKEFWYGIILPYEELANLHFSGIFHVSLASLSKSFDFLNQAKQSSSALKALEFQNRFESYRISLNTKLGTPIHPRPERLVQECEKIYSDFFVPGI